MRPDSDCDRRTRTRLRTGRIALAVRRGKSLTWPARLRRFAGSRPQIGCLSFVSLSPVRTRSSLRTGRVTGAVRAGISVRGPSVCHGMPLPEHRLGVCLSVRAGISVRMARASAMVCRFRSTDWVSVSLMPLPEHRLGVCLSQIGCLSLALVSAGATPSAVCENGASQLEAGLTSIGLCPAMPPPPTGVVPWPAPPTAICSSE
jgi:hypothetical protein